MEICTGFDNVLRENILYDLSKRVAIGIYGSFSMWKFLKKNTKEQLENIYGSCIDFFVCSYEKIDLGEEFNQVYTSVIFPVIPMERIACDREGYERERFICNLIRGIETREIESNSLYREKRFLSSNEYITFPDYNSKIEVISCNYLQITENNVVKRVPFTQNIMLMGGLFPDVIYNNNVQNIILPVIDENSVLFLISSVIDASISESSIFDREERREQVIEQCKSIRKNVKNSIIIIIECSCLNIKDLYLLNNVCDCIVNFKGDPYSEHLTHIIRDKTKSEAYTLSVVVNHLRDKKFKMLFKMTSRYRILKTFILENYSDKYAVFRPTDGSISYSKRTSCDSIFYSIPYCLLDLYLSSLIKIQQNRQLYIDMEHALHDLFVGNYIGINRDDILGFSAAGLYNQL